MGRVTQMERRRIWMERIAQQEKSGESVRAYCQQRGLKDYSFYFWRQRLLAGGPITFALVETKPDAEVVMVELVWANGDRMPITNDEETLRTVLAVIRGRLPAGDGGDCWVIPEEK